MSEQFLNDDEREALWKRAASRLALVDVEPPVSMAEVDGVFEIVGARPAGTSLSAWLERGAFIEETAPSSPPASELETSNNVTSLSDYRQRFRPVATFVRLAADSGDQEIGLPTRPLETDDGLFRLSATAEDGSLRIEVQALGMASADWSERCMGLSGSADDQPLLAIFTFDEDGDAEIVIDDTPAHREILLRPVIGAIDEA